MAETDVADWPPPIALVPRIVAERCDRREALRLLERERILAMALAVRAIAYAWDRGVINAPAPGELPQETEVLGIIQMRDGLARQRVAEAEAGVHEAMRAVAELEDKTPGLRPLDELIDDFGLSTLARYILMAIVAPHVSGEAARLYRIATADPMRPLVDEALLVTLLGARVNPHDLARELDPDHPLVGAGLVRVDDDQRPFAALSVDPLVLARLRGETLDADPAAELDVVAGTHRLGELRIDGSAVAALGDAVTRPPVAGAPIRIAVRGRAGTGRRSVLASLARSANRPLAMIHLGRLGDAMRPTLGDVRRALERCRLAGWIPCLDGFELFGSDDHATLDRIRTAVDQFAAPVMARVDPEQRPAFEPGYAMIDVPDLTESQRVEVWRDQLAAHGIDTAEIAGLAARWRVGPGTIHDVVAQLPHHRDDWHDRAGDLIAQAVGQHLERRLGDVAERIKHLPKMESLVLPPDIVDSLTELLSRLRHRRLVYEQWGMENVATTARGITALFQGPSGTGKTMVAGALARELGLDLYRVDLSRVMSKWIGETERNLASVFAAAEEGQAIVLFDEADSLFTKRTEVKSSNDRFANLEVNYLLQRLDSFNGIAILTTNLGTAIDTAFKRRLSFRVTFPIPDEELRAQLWRAHLPAELPQADDIDVSTLAEKYQLTGGSVRNCALRAAFLAAAENVPLAQEHLLRAIRLEYRSVGKLAEGGPLE